MKEAFDLIRKRIEEITVDRNGYGTIRGCNLGPCKDYDCLKCLKMNVLSFVDEAEVEYINKSTEHINKSSDCSTGWIPCSERLPENDDDVLVWYRYRTMQGVNIVGSKETHGIGYYYKPTNSWLIYGGFGLYWNVVAWMPLPESYKPEKGAQDGGDNEGNNKD